MNGRIAADEHLEALWCMKEQGQDSVDDLRKILGESFDSDVIDELLSEGLVEVSEADDKIVLATRGEDRARKLIRAHRLAERLIHDVLGAEFESGACEFEHIITPEITDSVCTLLGHPRECPHGMPIPEGDCCDSQARTAKRSVIPLTELETGQSARVAYVNCTSDERLHRIEGLQIRPGAVVKLHQKYPTYVVECENSHVAMDDDVVSSICVWRAADEPAATEGPGDRRKRFRFRRGVRGQDRRG